MSVNDLFYKLVPALIILGVLLLLATYLGRIVGSIAVLGIIVGIIYVVYRFLKETFK